MCLPYSYGNSDCVSPATGDVHSTTVVVVIVDAPAAIEQITALARPAAQQQLNLSKLYFALAFLQ